MLPRISCNSIVHELYCITQGYIRSENLYFKTWKERSKGSSWNDLIECQKRDWWNRYVSVKEKRGNVNKLVDQNHIGYEQQKFQTLQNTYDRHI